MGFWSKKAVTKAEAASTITASRDGRISASSAHATREQSTTSSTERITARRTPLCALCRACAAYRRRAAAPVNVPSLASSTASHGRS